MSTVDRLEILKEKITEEKNAYNRMYNMYAKKEEEIERLKNIIEKLEQENVVLKTQIVNKDKYSYGIRMESDKE